MRALARHCAHRGPGRYELQDALAPDVALCAQSDAHHTVRAESVSLGLHPAHRQFPGGVHRLRQYRQLLVLSPSRHLNTDVIDRGTDDEAERFEPGLLE